MTARVRGVMARRMASGSTCHVDSSESTKMGTAPVCAIVLTEAM